MIYFDNGSTSFPKAPGVTDAMADYINNGAFNINRGNYEGAYDIEEMVLETRELLLDFFKAPKETHVVFTPGITYSLNYFIKGFLKKGDVLVINNSRVIPARLMGTKKKAPDSIKDGAKCEVLLLKCTEGDKWECIVHPGKRLKMGAEIEFAGGLSCVVREVKDDGNRIVEFFYDKEKYGNIFAVLDVAGSMPTPPYITKKLEDKSRYQTVYADKNGSAAAPTAGLHFTKELLAEIEEMGVKIAPVMLHVGLGTFRPVKVENIKEHKMHSEYFEVSEESARIINSAKANGGRVIAVGTTSTRVLESASTDDGIIHPMCADTEIFIYPGYKFKMLDGLITNFHLPESTLLMLVSAFSSREIMLSAYEEAVREKYRFFSFGDAMFIV